VSAPLTPQNPDRLRAGARAAEAAAEDEAVLTRIDATELHDIHRGLEWCERELRALGLRPGTRRRRIVALRRQWEHRWRAATGRPAVSLQVYRVWKAAALVAAAVAVFGITVALEAGETKLEPYVAPIPTPAIDPESAEALMAPDPMPAGQPGPGVSDRIAKSRAVRLARRLEDCARPRGTFVGCLSITPRGGRFVRITHLAVREFRVSSVSRSGNVFSINRGSTGLRERTCWSRVAGSCPARTGDPSAHAWRPRAAERADAHGRIESAPPSPFE
jgi:hypothetical protein